MPLFHMDARFCTRSGRPGRWSESVTAPDIATAIEQARQFVERRYRGISKLDVYAVADEARPSSDGTVAGEGRHAQS